MEVVEKESRLKLFPIMMYAVVMGFSGLTITYQKATLWLGFPSILGEVFMYLTTIIFIVVSIIYITKFSKYKIAVKNEFSHPIRINFFAAISISMLMLAIIYKENFPLLSAIFWYPATLLHFYLTMHTISFWINKNQQLDHSNPAWFIPIVGNVLVPVAGVGFADLGLLLYFFSVGMFFWIILFSVILNRIIFHNQMAVKFMPTLFILIAPPAVGFIAYFKMFGVLDTFAIILFNLALFFTILVAFMYKNFIKIKFFISWWAFVFPVAAMAISTMLMYHQNSCLFLLLLSYIMIAAVTIIVSIVSYQTIVHIRKKEICIQE
ncbi:MAG: SLAC1 anion channel family protein [Sulfurimonas sp.]|jgi:tellurite resistance protein|uniref:SLAC1 anion channel family protein n=1 Tax=unclassified Sulfurimonas TaxID=2623549 RepID=UPI0008C6ACC0|nr:MULTISPECIES: SLAC1 anion channel family protein [unclassified Sulfurimonas]MBS4068202.1 SLAC1 anion channel family protein [Sulfurimonas sp.]MDD3856411.1 SLAC1 anion channel family protein [Sulfurimonas sp.]OHE04241.1 MAG: C4-dicarboxylate ABC transporter [Sulfurimonas sp. RIFOXYB12_FULL_35_9]